MSYDGAEVFGFRPVEDEDEISRYIKKARRIDPFDGAMTTPAGIVPYVFGFGEQRPVCFEPIAELLKPKWNKWPARSSETIRHVEAAEVAALLARVEELKKSRRRFADRVNGVLLNPEEDLADRLASSRVSDLGETTGERLVAVLIVLGKALAKAAEKECGLLIYYRQTSAW